ncbi:squamosa promoter-binding-like protein 14 [Impatiens glandulifera]|uniref:squamosa promoter-binding-like protein 14 n=1 Tax=Impatiens glandulifera TaxID=253017 RepID=UPI001FB0F146|nr:squamosa promoter-binding-like protein 14 [Impatiens glandulifera]
MEELGTQVAPPIFVHQNLAGRFHDGFTQPLAKKRAMTFQGPGFHPQQFQNQAGHWNSSVWGWDSVGFAAKPLNHPVNEVNETLSLNLGGNGRGSGTGSGNGSGCSTNSVEETVSRPGKKVRSGSPCGSNYPKCQVDDCGEDLSNAKEYHRRHKVCEGHSKSSKAMVGNQMQRFCQQCSRFHLLTEFDEGKRSCRRRLAGHNKRRRKTQTQTEDASSQNLIPKTHENNTSPANLDIINLLTVLARAQGTNEEKGISSSIATNKDQLIEILRKINSLPLPTSSGITPTNQTCLDNFLLNSSASSQSTKDLLAVLSQGNIQRSSADKNSKNSYHPDQALDCTVQKSPATVWGGERSSSSYQSPCEDADSHIQGRPSNVPLQLFSSSPEGNSPLTGRIYSSDSSNPMDESSPSSSPPVEQSLFPMHTYRETELVRAASNSLKANNNVNFEKGRAGYVKTSLDLFGESITASESGLYHHGEHTTSSGSDHSPSSLTSESKERTGRISFKLFDKDPSHLPGTLKTQINNWLLNSPSDMESYIRPGCVFLSVYLSMPSSSWEQLEENILQRINSLIHNPGTDFWNKGRFIVQTNKQLASHKDGRVRLCKSWRATSNTPELFHVSPLAIMAGKETSLLLKGKNLNAPETKIYCTYMGGYISMGSASQKTEQDELTLDKFKIMGESSGVLGRCFIEVENGFKSAASFPIIIADASICQELKVLEYEFNKGPNVDDRILNDQLLHFLNELGWLFQRKQSSLGLSLSGYSISRFKSLLVFSVDRNCCALVKTILGLLLERSLIGAELARESLEMLTEIHLLNRAVKRKYKNMIHLLINYSVPCSNSTTEYIFLPNQSGPGGITPLHLAASMSNSEDIVDVLTDDPQEIGLLSWHSLLDGNGQSPHAYASMKNNHTYNSLIARKQADRKNSQVSVSIRSGIEEQYSTTNQNHEAGVHFKRGPAVSCSKCAVVTARYKGVQSAHTLLHSPFIHSLLAIAAVCVCVCLFMRGAPDIRSIAPFQWENLEYGCS